MALPLFLSYLDIILTVLKLQLQIKHLSSQADLRLSSSLFKFAPLIVPPLLFVASALVITRENFYLNDVVEVRLEGFLSSVCLCVCVCMCVCCTLANLHVQSSAVPGKRLCESRPANLAHGLEFFFCHGFKLTQTHLNVYKPYTHTHTLPLITAVLPQAPLF